MCRQICLKLSNIKLNKNPHIHKLKNVSDENVDVKWGLYNGVHQNYFRLTTNVLPAVWISSKSMGIFRDERSRQIQSPHCAFIYELYTKDA